MKLCLGTVQFGMNYGIQGGKKPSAQEAVKIMSAAVEGGVDAIDTAIAYGDAESVVGQYLSVNPGRRKDVFLVSKFGADIFQNTTSGEFWGRLENAARQSLSRMGVDCIDAYICHDPTLVGVAGVLTAMKGLKDSGVVKKTGFSVYEVEEAEVAIKSGIVDFLQVPYSIFDQRMETAGIFEMAASYGVEIHSRSAFVQGLALMSPDAIPQWLSQARYYVRKFEKVSRETGISRRRLLLSFVKRQAGISHLVFGVDNLRQLNEILEDFSADVPADVFKDVDRLFADIDPSIAMPNKWRRP